MPDRFCLSARKDRSKQAEPLLEALKSHGWERTLTWTPQDEGSTDGYGEIALKELDGVRDADVLIVLLPGGYGTHVEIGAALALGKQVILHAPDRKILEAPYPCIFHYHPSVKILISPTPNVAAI